MRRATPPSSRTRRAGALIVVAAAIGAAAWMVWRRSEPLVLRPGACAGCNVLLITIDTLRVDRVDAFGGTRNLTPTLDRLAGEGVKLTRTYASAPLTLPSHASILTSVSPPVHGLRTNGLFRLGPKLPTLATVLQGAGYRTGAFVGAFVLDARFGLTRGFEVYDDRYGEKHAGDPTEGAERRAEDVIRPATQWILGRAVDAATTRPRESDSRARDEKWFAWVHLYDPHEPYRAPEPWASQHEPYDAEVAYTDAMVGKLLDDLRAGGQLDRTLVVVAADHGESLGEHGERTHGVFAYDATLRVPWMLWAGPRLTPASSDALVRLIDLAPTTLDLVGVAAPAEFEGRSVLAAAHARSRLTLGRKPDTTAAHERMAYIEAMDANLTRNWAPLTGIVSGGYKLIDLPIPELYDLDSDPRETTNLYTREGARARALESLLRDTKTALAAPGAGPEKMTLGAEARQRLQALGYVASSAEPGQRVFTDADDPKTLIGPADELNRALSAFQAGSHAEAMASVRAILQAHPGFATAYGMLASMQRDTGDLRAAIATLEDVVRRGIADASVMVVLAGYLQEAGALATAIGVLEAVIASHPDYAEAYNSMGVVYSRMGRHDRARTALAKVLELDPTSAIAYENLGVDEIAAGDLTAAAVDLTRALDLDPRLAGAHNALATVYMRQHRPVEAIAHWQVAVQVNPRLYDALYNLGTALHRAGRRDDARPYLERFASEAPASRYAADIATVRRMLER